jgi:histidinol-phosphatase (PHP family)
MIREGIRQGLTTMCFTEHMDFDYVADGLLFEVDTKKYLAEYRRCLESFGSQIELLFGIELGLMPSVSDRLAVYTKQWDFDFIIGSSHTVRGADPYDASFFEGRSEEDCYRDYFLSILENLDVFSDIDVYGHLDYVVRYGPNKNKYYSYEKYSDILDAILKKLIEKGIGLEVNTAGFKYGLGMAHPHPDILKRYREFGGEILTVGSDGHAPEHLAYDFHKVKDLLTSCGFSYYTIFRNRKPVQIKL